MLSLAIYFLPAIIGRRRKINSRGALFFVNLFFGWTLFGWFLCLLWAATAATRAQDAFFARAAARAEGPGDTEQRYDEAYARERARLDHEASRRERAPNS